MGKRGRRKRKTWFLFSKQTNSIGFIGRRGRYWEHFRRKSPFNLPLELHHALTWHGRIHEREHHVMGVLFGSDWEETFSFARDHPLQEWTRVAFLVGRIMGKAKNKAWRWKKGANHWNEMCVSYSMLLQEVSCSGLDYLLVSERAIPRLRVKERERLTRDKSHRVIIMITSLSWIMGASSQWHLRAISRPPPIKKGERMALKWASMKKRARETSASSSITIKNERPGTGDDSSNIIQNEKAWVGMVGSTPGAPPKSRHPIPSLVPSLTNLKCPLEWAPIYTILYSYLNRGETSHIGNWPLLVKLTWSHQHYHLNELTVFNLGSLESEIERLFICSPFSS